MPLLQAAESVDSESSLKMTQTWHFLILWMHKENEGPILDLHQSNMDHALAASLVSTKPTAKTYFSKPSIFVRKNLRRFST